MPTPIALIIAVGLCADLLTGPVLAITRIADTSTAVPVTGGHFTSFEAPTLNRGALGDPPAEVGFRADTSTGVRGIYQHFYDPPLVNPITRDVDTTMAMPGFAQNFGDFVSMSLNGYAFKGIGADGIINGLYFGTQLIAQPGDTVGGMTINTIGGTSSRTYQTDFGIVRVDSTSPIAQSVLISTSSIFGGEQFVGFGRPSLANARAAAIGGPMTVAFRATKVSTAIEGIYEISGSATLERVMNFRQFQRRGI